VLEKKGLGAAPAFALQTEGNMMQAPRQKRLGHDERRQKIIETTLACLARDGADGTTLRGVCREMGVAPSLITHFFAGWHDVLTAAYEMLSERFLAQLAPVLSGEYPSARARMDAMIARYLSTDWIGENTIGANIALWQLARNVVDLRPHFSASLRDRRAVLRQALGALAAERGAAVDLEGVTDGFMLMLDGVWLEMSVNPGNIGAARAAQIYWCWLDLALRPGGEP
jgi:AcrR family transcriptional regulator